MPKKYQGKVAELSAWNTLGRLASLVVGLGDHIPLGDRFQADFSMTLDRLDSSMDKVLANQVKELPRIYASYVHGELIDVYKIVNRKNITSLQLREFVFSDFKLKLKNAIGLETPFLNDLWLESLVISKNEISALGGPAAAADSRLMRIKALGNIDKRQMRTIRKSTTKAKSIWLEIKDGNEGKFRRNRKSTPYALERILRYFFSFTNDEITKVLKIVNMIHYPLNPMSEEEFQREVSGNGKSSAIVTRYKKLGE